MDTIYFYMNGSKWRILFLRVDPSETIQSQIQDRITNRVMDKRSARKLFDSFVIHEHYAK